jgi:hypothetical protein
MKAVAKGDDGGAANPQAGADDIDAEKQHHHHDGRRLVLVAERAAPVAGKSGLLRIGRQMNRKIRRQQYSEIADRQQRECGNGEPMHQFTLRFWQQHQRCGYGGNEHRQGEAFDRRRGIER